MCVSAWNVIAHCTENKQVARLVLPGGRQDAAYRPSAQPSLPERDVIQPNSHATCRDGALNIHIHM